MDKIRKIINTLYRKSASLNLYVSNCNVKNERVLKELDEIKLAVENAENDLKRL